MKCLLLEKGESACRYLHVSGKHRVERATLDFLENFMSSFDTPPPPPPKKKQQEN